MARDSSTCYSTTDDLLLDDTNFEGVVDLQKYVSNAADEIDSFIGGIYLIPVASEDSQTELLLSKINNFLATGRILMTTAKPGEEDNLNALGKYYVDQAQLVLKGILGGDIILIAPPPLNSGTENLLNYPTIVNVDPGSRVDDFYIHFKKPRRPLVVPALSLLFPDLDIDDLRP